MKLNEKNKLRLVSLIIVAVGILLDQLTKLLAVRLLQPVGSVQLLPGVVDLTYVENRGAAFGMLANDRWVFMIISTVAIIGISIYILTLRSRGDMLTAVALSMIVSGGIGNMIDRIALGYVVDFIDISPLFPFAVFNGADCFVCVGGALVVLACIIMIAKEEKQKKSPTAAEDTRDGE